MSFSFGFSGDDIENDHAAPTPTPSAAAAAADAPPPPPPNQAFPVPGQPQLPPTQHHLNDLLASLPSKISYSLLDVPLFQDASSSSSSSSSSRPAITIRLPRRELWDVRVQIMAEDEDVLAADEDRVDNGGLGKHDVKTGIYEGGFKSWESSVDLVKVLAARGHLAALHDAEGASSSSSSSSASASSLRVVELGCGTALPSIAIFQSLISLPHSSSSSSSSSPPPPSHLILADYNPSVLRLVTLPNLLLAWALAHHNTNTTTTTSTIPALADAFSLDGEFEISPDIISAFTASLAERRIHLSFLSGAWSPPFLDLLYSLPAFDPSSSPESSLASSSPSPTSSSGDKTMTLLMGAETIYSPFALKAFTETLFAVLQREKTTRRDGGSALAYVAAKRLYFGVGGSLTDFVDGARDRGALVTELSEETEGVRRGVVSCALP